MNSIIKKYFENAVLGSNLSLIELDILEKNYDIKQIEKFIDNPLFKRAISIWSKDSIYFLNQYFLTKEKPVERYKNWSNVSVAYMDDHPFVYSSIPNESYPYYLAVFMWHYFNKTDELILSRNYLDFWIMDFNPVREDLSYIKHLIYLYQSLSESQFRVLRIFIYRMLKDNILIGFNKNIEDAFWRFWFSAKYEELNTYLSE